MCVGEPISIAEPPWLLSLHGAHPNIRRPYEPPFGPLPWYYRRPLAFACLVGWPSTAILALLARSI